MAGADHHAPPGAGPGAEPPTPRPRSPLDLFIVYSGIALQSFGGSLAHTERAIVQEKRWFTAQEFLGMYAVSQVMPGPTGVSLCVQVGDRFFGLRGAAAALAGFLLPPAAIVLCLAVAYQQHQHLAWVQGALHGMGAAAVGLIVHTAARMARTLKGQRVATVVAVLTFCAVTFLRLPVSVVMLSLGLGSVAWAWHRLGRA